VQKSATDVAFSSLEAKCRLGCRCQTSLTICKIASHTNCCRRSKFGVGPGRRCTSPSSNPRRAQNDPKDRKLSRMWQLWMLAGMKPPEYDQHWLNWPTIGTQWRTGHETHRKTLHNAMISHGVRQLGINQARTMAWKIATTTINSSANRPTHSLQLRRKFPASLIKFAARKLREICCK